MSKRGEEENVPAEEDVNQRGGCEADLKEMTFKVSTQRQEDDWTWNAVQPWARPWQETDQERILDSSEAPADFFVYGRFLNWQTRFSEQRLSIRSRSLRPTVSHAQPRFSFSSGLRAPERKSSLEIVLILLDTLLENLSCSATKGVLDLEALAPRLKHLIRSRQ